jgi:Fe-S-cluster containining protein
MNMGTEGKNIKEDQSLADSESELPVTDCKRCGICCKKGGPSFHHIDKPLIENGVIHSKYLYTLRKGEYAYDNVRACLLPVPCDIIKLKGKLNTWICVFFEPEGNVCRIYENRPLECRALKCWDTHELESIYAKNRLTRKDLVAEIKGLWELIEDHQRRCDYIKINKLVRALRGSQKSSAHRQLVEIIKYDGELRKLVVSQGGLDVEILDFLFGRPLIKTIENFGWKVCKEGRKIVLVPCS